MRTLILGFLVSAVVNVATLAHADELTDRFVLACVSQGDNAVNCECTANAMQSTFSPTEFSQIVTALESGNSEAGEAVLGAIFASQPELIETLRAAITACQ